MAEISTFFDEIAKKRQNLPYQIDGIVALVNNSNLFKKLGVAGKSPRGIRAYKFTPKQSTTQILDIRVYVGRTGAITPVAELESVQIAGVTITRATLHNEDEIKRLGVKIGYTVMVERAGDVIPHVTKVLSDLRTGREKPFNFPKQCPVCGTPLIRPVKEVVWRCHNRNCPARRGENLFHFISRKAFNVEGLGPKLLNKLMEENLVSQPVDIFKLKEGDLIPLERFAEKSAQNLARSIEKSKKIELSRFIYALGIRYVGEETAIDLANHFKGIDKLIKSSKEDLEKAGVEIINPKGKALGTKFKGKTFVLTGELKSITRDKAKERIRSLGGNSSESVSKETDYVVVGNNPGSKLEKAKELGVKIVREKEFLTLLS